jgi:hypothetical protein
MDDIENTQTTEEQASETQAPESDEAITQETTEEATETQAPEEESVTSSEE